MVRLRHLPMYFAVTIALGCLSVVAGSSTAVILSNDTPPENDVKHRGSGRQTSYTIVPEPAIAYRGTGRLHQSEEPTLAHRGSGRIDDGSTTAATTIAYRGSGRFG